MRLVIHDYPGHAFPIQLARTLAGRGHEVLFLFNGNMDNPSGPTAPRPSDPPGLTIMGLDLGERIAKYSPIKRYRQERAYGRLLARAVKDFAPDAVLSDHAPLAGQELLAGVCRVRRIRLVYWVQDIMAAAAARILPKRYPLFGGFAARMVAGKERDLLEIADAIVVIADDFKPILTSFGLEPDRMTVIHNWAPLEEFSVLDTNTEWKTRQGFSDQRLVIYSGTLGLKHNPDALFHLAKRLESDAPGTRLLVISQGIGADHLKERKAKEGAAALTVLPFQPFEDVNEALGSAEILLALLEPGAGVFSAPSKILSYFCAGRPTVMACPKDNLSAKTLVRAGGGVVTPPGDDEAFAEGVLHLLEQPELAQSMGRDARRYAEQTFDIKTIAERFESLLSA